MATTAINTFRQQLQEKLDLIEQSRSGATHRHFFDDGAVVAFWRISSADQWAWERIIDGVTVAASNGLMSRDRFEAKMAVWAMDEAFTVRPPVEFNTIQPKPFNPMAHHVLCRAHKRGNGMCDCEEIGRSGGVLTKADGLHWTAEEVAASQGVDSRRDALKRAMRQNPDGNDFRTCNCGRSIHWLAYCTVCETVPDKKGIVFDRVKPVMGWHEAVARLYAQWDDFKLTHRNRKAAENEFEPQRPCTAREEREVRMYWQEAPIARAFAISLPAESERAEYLAPYRMREGYGG